VRGYKLYPCGRRVRPYTIEYRDISIRGAGWPISLRILALWRVGAGIDDRRKRSLVPEHDVADNRGYAGMGGTRAR